MLSKETEFSQLKSRYLKAVAYFENDYKNDTEKWKEHSEKAFRGIIGRMNKLWDMMSDSEKSSHEDLFQI